MNKPLKKTASAESKSSDASVYSSSKKYKPTKAKFEANLEVSFKKGTNMEQIAEANLDIVRSFVNYLSDLQPVQFSKLRYSSKPVNRDDKGFEFISISSPSTYVQTGGTGTPTGPGGGPRKFEFAATGGTGTPIGGGGGPHKIIIVNSDIILAGLSESSKKIIQSIKNVVKNIK